jgi:hypothetical protein
MQCTIFREANDIISILGLNAVFLLPEGKEPSVPVRVSHMEGCEVGARAFLKKSSGGVVSEEAARIVARKEDATGAQLMPGGGEV